MAFRTVVAFRTVPLGVASVAMMCVDGVKTHVVVVNGVVATFGAALVVDVDGAMTPGYWHHCYQPRSRHAPKLGRSAPSVVSLPCPG